MTQPNNCKVHYKMYKKGRVWLFAGIAAFTWQISTLNANADTAATPATTALVTPGITSTDTAVASPTSDSTTAQNDSASNSSSTDTVTESTDTTTTDTDPAASGDKTVTEDSTTTKDNTATENKTATDDNTAAKDNTATTETTQKPVDANNNQGTVDKVNPAGGKTETTTNGQNEPNSATESVTADATETTESTVADPVVATSDTTETAAPVAKMALAKAATDTDIASDTFGDSAWRLDSNGVLHISGGNFANTAGKNPWAAYADQVKSIVFEGEVNAAADSSNLFYKMTNLTQIDNIDNLKTTKVTSMKNMFRGTGNLANLDLSSWDTSNVTDMSYVFYDATNTTTLNVSTWNTSKVTTMNHLFYGLTSLANLDVSNWDTSKVTNMNSLFRNMPLLTSLNVSKWNTSQVTDMSSMFKNLSIVPSLDVSNFDTSQVQDMSYMFVGMYKLASLNVSNFDTRNVTNMRDMFAYMETITELDLSNFDTSNVTNMCEMFNESYNLQKISTSNWNTSKVTDMSYMFSGGNHIQSLAIADWDTSHVTTMSHMFYYVDRLVALDIANWNTSNVTDMAAMFSNTWALTTVDLSKWDVSNVADMSDMFNKASSLTTLDFSNWDMTNVASTTTMLANTNLQKISLGAKNVWQSDTGLPNITANHTYSGNWISTDDAKTYNSSALLASNVPGTYIRETATAGTTINADDSTLIIGPNTTWNAEDNFTDAKDYYGNDLTLADMTVTGDTVDPTTAGTYQVTYSYTDATGKTVSKTITVTVEASTAAVNTPDHTAALGDQWDAQDQFSGVNADGTDIDFKDVTVSGDTVDTATPGTYNVTYSFTDSAGNVITKTVKVVIYGIVLNETNKEISTTSHWDPATNVKKATDGAGNELAGSDLAIMITDSDGNTVSDFTKPGTYTVTYTFMTRAGETYTTTSTIVVSNKASLDVQDSELTAGDPWQAENNFVSGTDDNGDALDFSQVTVSGTVDTSTPGTYEVTYTYKDSNGNLISKVATVTVKAKDTDTSDNGDGDNNGNTGNGNNNGNGDTDTDDNNNSGSNTGDNNNGSGNTNGNGDGINTGNTGNGNQTSNNNGNSQADTIVTTPTNTAPQASSTQPVSLKAPTKPDLASSQSSADTLPQTDENSTRHIAVAGAVLLALSGLAFGLGKALIKRRQN